MGLNIKTYLEPPPPPSNLGRGKAKVTKPTTHTMQVLGYITTIQRAIPYCSMLSLWRFERNLFTPSERSFVCIFWNLQNIQGEASAFAEVHHLFDWHNGFQLKCIIIHGSGLL